jgi:Tetracyclin repressor-like, C-terminal domain
MGGAQLTGCRSGKARVTPHKATNEGSFRRLVLHSWPCAEKRRLLGSFFRTRARMLPNSAQIDFIRGFVRGNDLTAAGALDSTGVSSASSTFTPVTTPPRCWRSRPYLAATRDERLRGELHALLEDFRSELAGWLRRKDQSDPERTAAVLAAAIDGVLLHRALDPNLTSAAVTPVLSRLLAGDLQKQEDD